MGRSSEIMATGARFEGLVETSVGEINVPRDESNVKVFQHKVGNVFVDSMFRNFVGREVEVSIRVIAPGSSSGKTAGFDPVEPGSNPGPGTDFQAQTAQIVEDVRQVYAKLRPDQAYVKLRPDQAQAARAEIEPADFDSEFGWPWETVITGDGMVALRRQGERVNLFGLRVDPTGATAEQVRRIAAALTATRGLPLAFLEDGRLGHLIATLALIQQQIRGMGYATGLADMTPNELREIVRDTLAPISDLAEKLLWLHYPSYAGPEE